MPVISLSDGRLLNYLITGPESYDKTILLANSLCAAIGFWDDVATVLEGKGFQILRFDYPGHGGVSTTGSRQQILATTFDTFADDVQALLSYLGLVKLFAWVGVSLGASLGIIFSVRFPGVVARLVVCDTISSSPINAGAVDSFGPRVEAARNDGGMGRTASETLERWFGKSWIEDHLSQAQKLKTLMEKTTLDGYETCCAALRGDTYDLRPLTGNLLGGGCVETVLMIVGENDANLPETMEELRATTGNGVKLEVIPKAGHLSFVDGFDQWVNVVLLFLGG